MFEPAGMGIVVFSPAVLVIVIVVSSATLLGILCTGGNIRRVSFKTLTPGVYFILDSTTVRVTDVRVAVGQLSHVFILLENKLRIVP